MLKTLLMPSVRRFSFLFILYLTCTLGINAQELQFNVSINAEVVQTTERAIFTEMENAFERFLNDTEWTGDPFRNNERIKGNLFLTITDQPQVGRFTANAQIQVIRPVFGSNYESLLLNFADRDWDFTYTQSQPLRFNETIYTDNITAMLSFYAYIALGLDYDSFSPLGGSRHYEKAQNIVNVAQNSGATGWGQFQNRRNRYWLLENLFINKQYEPLREAIYTYHRQVMDKFTEDPAAARAQVLALLKQIQAINRVLPNSIGIIAFLDAKNDEIVNMLKEGDMSVRRNAYNELLKLDPSRRSKYQQIVRN
mgnify:CR=1 FL=1